MTMSVNERLQTVHSVRNVLCAPFAHTIYTLYIRDSHPIAAIVSWEHHNLRHLGKTFGCSNKNSRKKASCPAQLLDWPDEDFGSVVEFIYSYTDANPEKTILAETATYDVDDITQTFHAL